MASVSYITNVHDLTSLRRARLRAKACLIVPVTEPFVQDGENPNSLKGMREEVRKWMSTELLHSASFHLVLVQEKTYHSDFGFQIFFGSETDAIHFKLRWVG